MWGASAGIKLLFRTLIRGGGHPKGTRGAEPLLETLGFVWRRGGAAAKPPHKKVILGACGPQTPSLCNKLDVAGGPSRFPQAPSGNGSRLTAKARDHALLSVRTLPAARQGHDDGC